MSSTSLYTAILYNHDDTLPATLVNTQINQASTQKNPSRQRCTFWLGAVTGITVETCNVGVRMATNLFSELAQQVWFSLAWSLGITMLACVIGMCIQRIAFQHPQDERADAFQVRFAAGAVFGLALAIGTSVLVKQHDLTVWWCVPLLIALIVVVNYLVGRTTKAPAEAEPLMIV